jgi:hypothetical protein
MALIGKKYSLAKLFNGAEHGVAFIHIAGNHNNVLRASANQRRHAPAEGIPHNMPGGTAGGSMIDDYRSLYNRKLIHRVKMRALSGGIEAAVFIYQASAAGFCHQIL